MSDWFLVMLRHKPGLFGRPGFKLVMQASPVFDEATPMWWPWTRRDPRRPRRAEDECPVRGLSQRDACGFP